MESDFKTGKVTLSMKWALDPIVRDIYYKLDGTRSPKDIKDEIIGKFNTILEELYKGKEEVI